MGAPVKAQAQECMRSAPDQYWSSRTAQATARALEILAGDTQPTGDRVGAVAHNRPGTEIEAAVAGLIDAHRLPDGRDAYETGRASRSGHRRDVIDRVSGHEIAIAP
jgi:hypothetical protein